MHGQRLALGFEPAKFWRHALFAGAVLTAIVLGNPTVAAQDGPPVALKERLPQAIVHIVAHISPEASRNSSLGPTRAGNGVIVDSSGLVVTIGYLIRGAYDIDVTLYDGRKVPGSFVGYDHESGFGLLRAQIPPGVTPMRIGDSEDAESGNPFLVLAADGPLPVLPVAVVSRRPFAGYWEYLLEKAIFTMPPQPRFGGAALVGRDGRLVGIGSLIISDAAGPQVKSPGNMFVPINLLKPMMAELLELGRPASKGPAWLGITTLEVDDLVIVRRVNEAGPAVAAGIRPEDIILGVGEDKIKGTIDFLRKVRALGGPGTEVPLIVVRREGDAASLLRILVTAASRYDLMEPRGF